MIPMWVCLCGARNRLRDTACRNCGDDEDGAFMCGNCYFDLTDD